MQEDESIKKNTSFFSENIGEYNRNVQELDTYRNIRGYLNKELQGTGELLDIGNGGVFDYNTDLPKRIVGLDLFLDNLPANFACPGNVTMKQGSALDIPFGAESFDAVLMVMLVHHLVGKTVAGCKSNVGKCISEACRVLKPGGKFIVIESCVPRWFYALERLGYPLYSRAINAFFSHPATIQYPPPLLQKAFEAQGLVNVRAQRIPKGRWLLMLGIKIPGFITPVMPYLFVGQKA